MSVKDGGTRSCGESTIDVTLVGGAQIRLQKIDIEGVRDVRDSKPLGDPTVELEAPSGANTCISLRDGQAHYVRDELRDLLR